MTWKSVPSIQVMANLPSLGRFPAMINLLVSNQMYAFKCRYTNVKECPIYFFQSSVLAMHSCRILTKCGYSQQAPGKFYCELVIPYDVPKIANGQLLIGIGGGLDRCIKDGTTSILTMSTLRLCYSSKEIPMVRSIGVAVCSRDPTSPVLFAKVGIPFRNNNIGLFVYGDPVHRKGGLSLTFNKSF
eukprot:TRINITY_DN10264_c0_g1_i2.p1 TRINITY_DN10264_c0_g1~~TRINITY_DN10264_c0_g1_i2.p1  ORF type:complete len:186 (-),score=27.79 TRINITY_DN10264_c0_g1_i2:17-574(-)